MTPYNVSQSRKSAPPSSDGVGRVPANEMWREDCPRNSGSQGWQVRTPVHSCVLAGVRATSATGTGLIPRELVMAESEQEEPGPTVTLNR